MGRDGRSGFVLAGCLVTALAAAGCDPCAGIADCEGSPRAAIEGRIVETATGVGVAGVRVDMIRQGAGSDSVGATTRADGTFSLAIPVDAAGPVTVDVAVRPPGSDGYRVEDMVVEATGRLGEAQFLPAWVTRPWFPFAGEAWDNIEPYERVPIVGEYVEFHRRGGAELAGPDWGPGFIGLLTDHGARFPLLPRTVTTETLEELVGELALVRENTRAWWGVVRLMPTHLYMPAMEVKVFRVGSHFRYHGQTRVGSAPLAGVQVTFRQVGGVPGEPTTFTTTTDDFGLFYLNAFRPRLAGDVTFDLTFVPPAPHRTFTSRVTLPTLGYETYGEPFAAFRVDQPDNPRVPFR